MLKAPDWEKQVMALTSEAEENNVLLRHITVQPALLFALASWLSFRRDLTDAVRFAGFGAEGAALERDRLYYECQYFKGVSLRMRLMSEAPTEKHEVDVWRSDMNRATDVLTSCLEQLPDAYEVRSLRAQAEGLRRAWHIVDVSQLANSPRSTPTESSRSISAKFSLKRATISNAALVN